MATPNKPPGDDPLSRLMAEAGKQIESRLKDWAARNAGGKGAQTTSRVSTTNNQLPNSPKPRGVRAADPVKTVTPQPTAASAPRYDGGEEPHKDFDRGKLIFRLIFFVLPALGVGKYLWSGKWQRNTDFNDLP